jgi:RNA recognition motif-containing protein
MTQRVFVGQIPISVKESEFRETFETFGAIKAVFLKLHYGFVEFEERDAADKAIRELNDSRALGSSSLRVELARGEPHPTRCFLFVLRNYRFYCVGRPCKFCSSTEHGTFQCPDKPEDFLRNRTKRCYNCQRVGHVARECIPIVK